MTRSKIEWTERTLNPGIYGCKEISPACRNCYAARMAHRLVGNGVYPEGITRHELGKGTSWTGRVIVDRARAIHAFEDLPSKPQGPTRVFVTSMADLFHHLVPDEHLALVFGAMASRPAYTFLVLTKRAERLAEWAQFRSAVFPWPENVWAGVTVENQAQANRRVPWLLRVPAPVRFVSCEPLLGPVDLTAVTYTAPGDLFTDKVDGLTGRRFRKVGELGAVEYEPRSRTIGWVIAGGETGPGARPTHPAWARSLRDQAAAAGTPFLWKQWGDWLPLTWSCTIDKGPPLRITEGDGGEPYRPGHAWGGFADEYSVRIGAHQARRYGLGRLLDDEIHDGQPVPVAP